MNSEENLRLYEAFRKVPPEAKKEIKGGRLAGKTDINPVWRMKVLTEQFGPCGVGWKYEVVHKELCNGADGEIAAFVDINLYIKNEGEWSAPIPGTGGAAFVAKEKSGFYTSDECFKMALTDAISVSCKALGVAADVYWEKDASKYDKWPQAAPPKRDNGPELLCEDCGSVIRETVKRDGELWPMSDIVAYSKRRFDRQLCPDCQKKAFAAEKAGEVK